MWLRTTHQPWHFGKFWHSQPVTQIVKGLVWLVGMALALLIWKEAVR